MKSIKENRKIVQLGFLILFIIMGTTRIPLLLHAVIVLTVLSGAVFCGWMCPFGFIQDIMKSLRKYFKIKSIKIPRRVHKVLKNLRYIIFGLSFLSIGNFLIELSIYNPFSNITLLITREYIGILSIITLVLFIVLSLFIDRFFCKYFCMEGAKYSLLSFGKILSIKRENTCVNCKKCEEACSVSLEITSKEEINDIECIRCGECVTACPIENTLSFKRSFNIKVILMLILIFILAHSKFHRKVVTQKTNIENYPSGSVIKTGKAKGYQDEITVDTILNGDKIVDIVVTSHRDTKHYFDSANRVIGDIIETQSVDVDTIAGATISSKGILKAVENSISE